MVAVDRHNHINRYISTTFVNIGVTLETRAQVEVVVPLLVAHGVAELPTRTRLNY